MKPVVGLRKATAVAVDARSKVVYYSDSRNFTIYRKGIFGGNSQIILDKGVGNCEGLAIDIPSGNLYYTDQAHSLIAVVNVERPQFKAALITTNLSNPRGIVVHSEKGYIFWTDWTDSNVAERGKSKIEKAKLDGSGRTVLVSTHIHWPNGLAIDYEKGRFRTCKT